MSDVPQSSALVKLATLYKPEIQRQVNRAAVTLSVLPSKRGTNVISFVVETDGAIAQTHAEGSDIVDFGGDRQVVATLDYGKFESGIHVTDEILAKAAAAVSPQGNIAYWARQLLNSSMKMGSKINVDLFGGETANGLVGFEAAIGSTSNTYAGIDRSNSDYALFRPYVASDVGATITKAMIREDLANIKLACNERPRLAIVNPLVYTKVLEVFDVQRRYETYTTSFQSVALGETQLESVQIEGCRFIEDKDGYFDSTNGRGHIYYLNDNYVHTETLPYVMPAMSLNGLVQSDGLPFDFDYKKLPTTSHASKAVVRNMIQLVVERPNTCGMRKFVAV